MKLNKQTILDYVHTTKLGNFLAVFIFCVVVELPVLIFSIDYFKGMVTGSFIVSIFLTLMETDKKWI